jgi:hypothetical protein
MIPSLWSRNSPVPTLFTPSTRNSFGVPDLSVGRFLVMVALQCGAKAFRCADGSVRLPLNSLLGCHGIGDRWV